MILKDTDEGELADLRFASVKNETFAQVVVKHNLHQFVQHSSEDLLLGDARFFEEEMQGVIELFMCSPAQGSLVSAV